MLFPGSRFQGASGRRYRIISPLSQKTDKSPHVWKAVNEKDEDHHFIVKQPSSDDDESQNWPAFQHELQMQRRFINEPFIRPIVDFIPASLSEALPPKMVLKAFEKTLWTARLRRELTIEEIRWIMKDVLIGLWTIHREGLVHSGLCLLISPRTALTDIK